MNDRMTIIAILSNAKIPFIQFHNRIEIVADGRDERVEGYRDFCTIFHFDKNDMLDKMGIFE